MINAGVRRMQMQEVCRAANVTRKAVEVAIEQKLIMPEIRENGYREFSERDAQTLRKIGVLRRLGLSTPQIRAALHDEKTLNGAQACAALKMQTDEQKQTVLAELAKTGDYEAAMKRLSQIEKSASVLTRLLDLFPGVFGRYIALHFAPFLRDPIETAQQRAAFDEIVAFLDGVRFDPPPDVQRFLEETALPCGAIRDMSDAMRRAANDPERYFAENRAAIEAYRAMCQSEEYQNSTAARVRAFLKTQTEENGYNEVFLPAMRRLSPSYRDYCARLKRADEAFQKEFPNEKT